MAPDGRNAYIAARAASVGAVHGLMFRKTETMLLWGLLALMTGAAVLALIGPLAQAADDPRPDAAIRRAVDALALAGGPAGPPDAR